MEISKFAPYTVKICNAFLTQNKHHLELKLDVDTEQLTVTNHSYS